MIRVRVRKFRQEFNSSFDDSFLCEVDRKKLSLMKSSSNRERFLFARKILYQVLSEEVGIDQSAISICMGNYGKPYLENPPKFVDFSISHCRDYLTIAVSLDEHVGVDIEDRLMIGNAPELTAICSVSELQYLSTSIDVDFLKLWTKKEAFMKLNGVGLFIDPKEVEVAQRLTIAYSGLTALRYSFANVIQKHDHRYVLSVAYPFSRIVDPSVEFVNENYLLEG